MRKKFGRESKRIVIEKFDLEKSFKKYKRFMMKFKYLKAHFRPFLSQVL